MSLASVARLTGMAIDPIKRHRASGHVAPGVPAPSPVAAPPAPAHDEQPSVLPDVTSAADALDALKRALDGMLATASPAQKVDIITEQRRLIESRARIIGPVAPTKIALADIEGYFEMETALFDALEPFPLARQAMARVLREMLARTRESAPDERGG